MLAENFGLCLKGFILHVRLVSRRHWIDICLCIYGMYMALKIFRPNLKCHIRALIALSPEYPQKLFAVCIQTCYTVKYEHIFLSRGSQIDAIVKHLITENFLPTVKIM